MHVERHFRGKLQTTDSVHKRRCWIDVHCVMCIRLQVSIQIASGILIEFSLFFSWKFVHKSNIEQSPV